MVTLVGTKKPETLSGTNDVNEVDYLYGLGGNDYLYGHDGENWIYGGAGDDRLHGNDHVDHLYGEDGNDTLFGGFGDDFIVGGAGNDKVYGGPGADMLAGGTGADAFHWARWDANSNGLDLDPYVDTITDFETGIDKIDISHFDADETTPFTRERKGEPGNDAFTYVNGTDGTTPGHLTLTYDPATGLTTLNAYTDTDAGADFTLLILGQVNPATDIVF